MKNRSVIFLVLATMMFSFSSFSQNNVEPESLGLPGDNLNLYAVLDIFQNSQTIEDFEKSLNEEDTKINNLDLNNDGKIDFIKVITKRDGDDFMFVLQDEIKKNDIQDVAVVFVNKDKNKNVSVQIVGDENLYGENYVVEPVTKNTTNTVNPAYTGTQTVTTTTVEVVNVQTSPVVVYLYSPVYVPYYPPYYYGFYPRYFHPWAPVFFSAYYHNHYHYHNHYYRPPYRHYPPHYAHYSSNRRTSVVVIDNTRKGNYKGTYNGNSYKKPANPTTRPANSTTRKSSGNTRPSNTSTRPSKQTTRPATLNTRPTTNQKSKPKATTSRATTTKVRTANSKATPVNSASKQGMQRNR